jgi:carbamoylphosphate synthase small subunit
MHDLTAPVVDVLDINSDEPGESEANDFASDWLMSRSRTLLGRVDTRAIVRLAYENGTSPGVVVGQLQNAGRIPHNRFNGLKRRYAWSGASLGNRRKN